MAGETQFSTLQGWFKELYASQEIKMVPEAAWMIKNIDFNKSQAGLGNLYHQPVVLTTEHGFTYAGPDAGAFALEDPVAAVMKDAQVQGSQLLLRSQIDYETLARAANTKGSFGEASKLLVQNMLDAMSKRLEVMFLYGRSETGIGVCSSGSTTTLVISAGSWAPALWAGMEGAKILPLRMTGTWPSQTGECLNASTATKVVVSTVNFETRTITLTAALSNAAASGDVVFFDSAVTGYGAFGSTAAITYRESAGLDAIISYQTGTPFNINVGTYALFRGNLNTTALGDLTVTKLLNLVLPAIGKGLMEDCVVLVSNSGFQGLVNPVVDPVAVRQASGSVTAQSKVGVNMTKNQGQRLELGADNIQIRGYQGKLEIVPHLFLKDSDVFVFPKKALMRVGATDITFNTPGNKGGEFFLHLPSNAGYELRCYANQGLFSPKPGHLTKGTLT